MNAIINSLAELIKTFTDSFRLSAVFPALLFIFLNWVFVLPYFEQWPKVQEVLNQELWNQALIIAFLTLFAGYTINAIEVPIVRFYEGYLWRDSPIGQIMEEWHRGRLEWLDEQIDTLKGEREILDQKTTVSEEELDFYSVAIKKYEAERKRSLPPSSASVLPTRLGNVIASFEAYPGNRYGMDGVTFWPRLFIVLAREEFLPYVSQTRYAVDFLLNTSLLMALFGTESLLLRLLIIPDFSLFFTICGFGLAWLFYMFSITSSYNWGSSFQVSFDLFRYQLAETLGLKPVTSFELEQEQWRGVTALWQSGKQFGGFDYSPEHWPVQAEGKKREKS